MNKIEIERKFLINPPNSWTELIDLFENLCSVKQIIQYYLSAPNEETFRLRKTVVRIGAFANNEVTYHLNRKQSIGIGISNEFEKKISESEYIKFLKDKRYEKHFLEKTRIVLRNKGLAFELDIFKGNLNGLVMMEVELPNIDHPVTLPTYITIYKEVTGDNRYSNANLVLSGIPQ